MRKSTRCIALMLVLCLVFSIAGTVAAANNLVDRTLVVEDYAFDRADHSMLRAMFCMDSRGFLKALAFESAEVQKRVITHMFSSTDPQSLDIIQHHLVILITSKNELDLTQSEKNLLSAMWFWKEYLHGLGSTSFSELDQMLQHALSAVALDQYSYDLGLFLCKGSYDFIIALSKLESRQQESILQQISVLNGTVESIRIVEIMQMLVGAAPPGSEVIEVDPSATVEGFNEAQNALFHAILNCLKDVPPYVHPQKPVPEELAQWQAEKNVPRTDFSPILLSIVNDGETFSYEAERQMFLDTAGFIQAFSQLQPSGRKKVIDSLLYKWKFVNEPQFMLYHTRSYLSFAAPDSDQQIAAQELMYALLRHGHNILGTIHNLSVYFNGQPENNPIFMGNSETYYHFSVEACFYPEDFITAYASAGKSTQSAIGIKVKSKFDPVFRQALIDIIYDLYEKGTLADDELAAAKDFLYYQGSEPYPMYPYGIDPNPPESTEPTESSAPTIPSAELTEPPAVDDTGENSGHQPQKDTGWIATVCFVLVSLCLGIAIGSLITKKKKAKQAAAQPQISPQLLVKAYPKLLYCPAPLEQDVQQQITLALRKKYGEYSIHWYSVKEPDGTCRCYGTENGYDIIFYAGGFRLEIPDSCTVGESVFQFATGFELYAHKGGTLTSLNAALEQRLVSPQAVQEALLKHKTLTE